MLDFLGANGGSRFSTDDYVEDVTLFTLGDDGAALSEVLFFD